MLHARKNSEKISRKEKLSFLLKHQKNLGEKRDLKVSEIENVKNWKIAVAMKLKLMT
jgi:hypothetical protein